jgi:hypothetical protein
MSAPAYPPNRFGDGPPTRRKVIGRIGVGHGAVRTPTLFRDLRKQLGSFRPESLTVLASWRRSLQTDARCAASSIEVWSARSRGYDEGG